MNNKVLYQIKTLEKIVLRKFLNGDKNLISCSMSTPTPTQMQILEYILEHENDVIYQKDLEKILNLRRATVSGVLHTMEKNQLIKRITDSVDTRTKRIVLNDKAKSIFLQHAKKMEKIEEVLIDGISTKDLETFSRIIEKMKENARNKLKQIQD